MKKQSNTIQAAWVALGGLFSMGFGIVSAMILSRYLVKEDYGLYKQVLYVYTTLNGLFALGLPKAYSYFLPRSPLDEAKSLIRKLTRIFFILGGILSVLLFCGSEIIADALNAPRLGYLLKIFSPVPFLMMPTMGLEGILATYQKTKLITVYVILTRLVMLLCVCIPVIFLQMSVSGALAGFVLSSLFSFLLALYLKYYPVKEFGKSPTSETYKTIFTFCFPLFVASIWGVLINSTDQFFISRYFGNDVFADFSNGAMELPFVGIIFSATTTVLTPLFTKQIHQGSDIKSSILPTWNQALSKSIMLIYPLTFFCLFDAQDIMVAMYGDQYIASASFFKIKLFTYFFKVIIFYSLIVALGATQFYQKLHLVVFVLLVISEYLITITTHQPLMITVVHVFYTILITFAMWFYVARALQVKVRSLIPSKTIFLVSTASLVSCGVMLTLKSVFYFNMNVIYKLILDAGVMLTVYTTMSYILKVDFLEILRPLICRRN